MITTSDNAVAEDLVIDPRVDLISFTGSTAVGRRIMEKGAPTLKRLFLELGGKSADIILDDADFEAKLSHGLDRLLPRWPGLRHADPDAAATLALRRGHRHHGGRASATSPTATRPTRATSRDPRSAPSSATASWRTSRGARPKGARVVVGGGRPAHLDKGYYVEPTLFADVENSMSIAQQEIFGPVLVVVPFDDDDDAVRVANDSEYGLGVGVTSASEERALAVARRIRAGTVGVNGGVWYGPDAPFGGYKASGIGRQNGIEGFEQYTETKTYAGGLPPK